MATAAIVVSGCATCVPLNPLLARDERRRLLAALAPAAIVTGADVDAASLRSDIGPGTAVMPIGALAPGDSPPASPGDRAPAEDSARAEPGHVAFVLPTSGTSGRAKLVTLSQRNIACSAQQTAGWLELSPTDRLLLPLPLHHAHGLLSGLTVSIWSGSCVICAHDVLPRRLLELLRELEPTWCTAVPAVYVALLGEARRRGVERHDSMLRLVRSASAPLAARTLEALERLFGVPVIESYGMTEATSQIASNPLPPRACKPGSVGLPVGVDVSVRDCEGRELGPSAVGELWLRGPSIASSYLNDEPVATVDESGWLRTGDDGYLDEERYLYVLGRRHDMINRGGEKVAPREIEDVMHRHPAVERAIAFGVPSPRLGEEVGLVVQPRPSAVVSPAELRRFARDRLTPFKVPKWVRVVSEIDTGPFGKPNRADLMCRFGPDLCVGDREVDHGHRYLALERHVAERWEFILDVPHVDRTDNFFLLGGDSLAAAELFADLEADLALELSVDSLLLHPTVEEFTEHLLRQRPAARTCPSEVGEDDADADADALSFAQRRLLVLDALDGFGNLYQTCDVIEVDDYLDVEALRAAFAALVGRHEILRSRIVDTPRGPGLGAAPGGQIPFQVITLDALEQDERSEVRRLVLEGRRQPQGPGPSALLSLTVLRARADYLLLDVHHCLADAWSLRLLWRELEAHYRSAIAPDGGLYAPLSSLPTTDYQSCVRAERQWLGGAEAVRAREYWATRLEGASAPPLRLAGSSPSSKSSAGARVRIRLDREVTQRLRELAAQSGTTPYVVLHTALKCLLARLTRCTDVTVGTLFANRVPEAHDVIGPFANTVALRTDLGGDPSFRDAVRRVHATTSEAGGHGRLPFEEVLEAARRTGHARRDPLFRVLHIHQGEHRRVRAFAGCAARQLELDPSVVREGLGIETAILDNEVDICLDYRLDQHGEAAIRRLGIHYRTLLLGALAAPMARLSALPLLTDAEREEELAAARPIAGRTWCVSEDIGLALGRALSRHAGRAAASDRRGTIEYASLDVASGAAAAALAALGAGEEDLIGIVANRGVELLITVVGVLRAGAAVLLIEPRLLDAPARWRHTITVSEPKLLIAGEPHLRPVRELCRTEAQPMQVVAIAALRDGESRPPRALVEPIPSRLAYAIFTSGSTGTPKGVLLENAGLVNHLRVMIVQLELGPSDVVAQSAPHGFDVCFWQLLAPLLCGARVQVIDDEVARDPEALLDAVQHHGITVLEVVPSVLSGMVEALRRRGSRGRPGGLRWMISTGEPLVRELAEAWLAACPGVPLMNAYGPAECCDDVSTFVVDRGPVPGDETVPIGAPVQGSRLYVLDEALAFVPRGVPGELFVGGICVGRGYAGDALATARSFLPDPFTGAPDARMYRTGDLVRRLLDGSLEYLGRIDEQVKVRGHRLELEEVDHALRACPEIVDAAVAVERDMLVAYLVTAPNEREVSRAQLRDHLRARLLSWMIPTRFVRVDALSQSPAGKVDRSALAACHGVALPDRVEAAAPASDTESTLR